MNECLSQIALLRSQFDAPIPGDQRQAARAPESAVVIVISANGQSFEAALHDLSIGGALVELDADELHGSACQVLLPGMAHSIDATADVSGHGKIRLLFPKLTGEDRIDLLKQIEGSSLRA
ncbi:MAG: PilZ domain-containing protein [Rhodobacteraceae bacterium]|nr:PilZ domain-containing protein [Paracoccaceae bacterium]